MQLQEPKFNFLIPTVKLEDVKLEYGYFGLIHLKPKTKLQHDIVEIPMCVVRSYDDEKLPVFTGIILVNGTQPYAAISTKEGLLAIFHESAIAAKYDVPASMIQDIQERMLVFAQVNGLESKGIITGIN